MAQHPSPLPDEGCFEGGFSPQDKAAIDARLSPYRSWSVAYTVADGVEYAQVRAAAAHAAIPELTLDRRDGLTGFAARWSDGSQFCSALSASLSGALCFIVQSIEDTLAEVWPESWLGAGTAGEDALALTLACRTPI